jgi:hypothetical protein
MNCMLMQTPNEPVTDLPNNQPASMLSWLPLSLDFAQAKSLQTELDQLRELNRVYNSSRHQPSDRKPVRTARNGIQSNLVEKRDARRIATMLATNPNLQAWFHATGRLERHANQRSNPNRVYRGERIEIEHVPLEVFGNEFPLRIVARKAVGHLGQVVRAEAEEIGELGDFGGDQAGAWQFDHRADGNLEAHS